MIKGKLTNEILNRISEIEHTRFSLSVISIPSNTMNRLRKNSKKKSYRRSEIFFRFNLRNTEVSSKGSI